MPTNELSNSKIEMELTKALITSKPDLFLDDLNDTIPRTAKVYRAMKENLDNPKDLTYDFLFDEGE